MYPDRVSGLISLDTAPTASTPDMKAKTLASLTQIRDINIEGKTKKAAMDLIASKYSDKGIANLITNNLAYNDDYQTVKWTCNLNAIVDNIDNLTGYSCPKSDKAYTRPAFFLNGTLSVSYPDSVYHKEFPQAKVCGIEGAGHYVHIDRGQTTCHMIGSALYEIEQS